MQKLQDSVFTLVKTTNLSPAVFSFLQPSDDSSDKTPLGGILKDTKHGWLALGPKFCVVDLKTGMKVASRTFGATLSNNASVTSVVELQTPLTELSQQLIISLQCDDIGIICVLNINGSQILRCIQTDVVITQLAVSDGMVDGAFTCFDGIVIAGTKQGEIIVFDLNRASLIKALKDISQGYEHLIQNELNPTNLSLLPLKALHRIEEQREMAAENNHHLAVLLNENSFIDDQYIFRNPDNSVRMKAKRSHIYVTVLEYIPQTGSVAVGFNFGAFQIWNLMSLDLEFTSQVNVECLPVTHFGFQEPCDDPRAFCYLWVVFSVIDRFEEEEFPLAVMYSLTYQGKRMLSDTKCLYQEFITASIRFQLDLNIASETPQLGGKCISCHTYSIKSTLGDEGEDSMLNLCQFVWECWAENRNTPMQYGMLLFDLDQWYKDQMPSTHRVESNAFLSSSSWSDLSGGSGGVALHARLDPATLAAYSHATRLEEHFFPNSLQYNCICLNTSEVCVLSTIGIQRQIISSMDEAGPTVLLSPPRLYAACAACGLAPLYAHSYCPTLSQEEQRRYLLSVALEARLARFLKRCAHDWATGSHSGVGCTLPFLVDWCWKRAIELKENAKELTAPLFTSSALPDRNIIRCLEHCVQQLTQLTGLMDAILTKCCNLVVPDALSEMEEKHKGIGTVSLYFQVVQWFLRVGLLPERVDGSEALPYPAQQLYGTYNKRRMKLNRIQENSNPTENGARKSCILLYIDQLIEQEFDGDRIHQMWIRGGSECGGLYPPPSLYALLRLYLLADIPEEHKHSLVLYLLVDYARIYDDVRYETVIHRLMQFPTMFGLSNTAIKATQAFWHLDHRDFDFALDQLQCLTGNTLSEWQHNVVLSSLLAQKKTQAALQYLHVRKPAPVHTKEGDYSVNDHDKLEDWQSCCNLYLARGLVYEALDVVRMCVHNAGSLADKTHVLNFFFKGCRNTGNLSKVLSITLLPLEEEVFVRYLENCKESQTSDILVMYYLQQARYLEAKRYNTKLRLAKPKIKEISASVESLLDSDRDSARDAMVEVMCSALPAIAETVAHCAFDTRDMEPHVTVPKPMSVFIQAKSPKNTFTYKSSFIQNTIENASETWMNRPTMRKGLKRMLNVEETPFICTPKLTRTRSIFADFQSESTPPKRARLNLSGTPKTPRSGFKVGDKLRGQMEKLLDMPELQSPVSRMYDEPDTPHSILKSRTNSRMEAASPTGSRYLESSDDDLEMETASNHTHYSDTNSKHLRFTIPTPNEVDTASTPSPPKNEYLRFTDAKERPRSASIDRERDIDISTDSYVTTASHAMNESNPLESPPKKLATEANVSVKKSYKDSVRARPSLSISANSSLSEDPNTSIESIADKYSDHSLHTLINPRYLRRLESKETEMQDTSQSFARQRRQSTESKESRSDAKEETDVQYRSQRLAGQGQTDIETSASERETDRLEVPKTPRGRRGIRISGESTPLRSGSLTPERLDSPIITPLRTGRISRSRSKTPELSPRSSPLAPIPELPKQETESEPHERSTISVQRTLRSRSRTPERMEKSVIESPKLEAIKESPTKSSDTESPPVSPTRLNLRSRSRTPEVEVILEPVIKPSPRSLRSRSKTPEKMTPKKESVRNKKSLSRLVLEANTFAKTKATLEKLEAETASEAKSKERSIECTPMKASKPSPTLMDVTLSPITNKSVLHSSNDSVQCEKDSKVADISLIPLPTFTPLQETYFEKSVLRSYESSVGESSQSIEERETKIESRIDLKPLPAFTTIHEDFGRSVLHSFESSVAESSQSIQESLPNPSKSFVLSETPINLDIGSVLHSQQGSLAESRDSRHVSSLITDDSDVDMKETDDRGMAEQKEKEKIVEIEREINEIEDMSNEESEGDGRDVISEESSEETSESENDSEDESEQSAGSDDAISIHASDSDSESPTSNINSDSNNSFNSGCNKDKKLAFSDDSSSMPAKIHTESTQSTKSSSDQSTVSTKTLPAFKGIKESDSDNSNAMKSPKHKRMNTIDSDSENSSQITKPKIIITPGTDSDSSSLPAMKQTDFKRIMKMVSDSENSSSIPAKILSEKDTDSESSEKKQDETKLSGASQSDDSNQSKKSGSDSKSSASSTNSSDSKKSKNVRSDSPSSDSVKSPADSEVKPHASQILEDIEMEITNPLDLAQVSLMTEDNSTLVRDDIELDHSKDPLNQKKYEKEDKTTDKMVVDSQTSLMTDDNSEASDQELSLNYSDDFEKSKDESPEKYTRIEDIPMPEEPYAESAAPQNVDVVDTAASETEIKEHIKKRVAIEKGNTKEIEKETAVKTVIGKVESTSVKELKTNNDNTLENKDTAIISTVVGTKETKTDISTSKAQETLKAVAKELIDDAEEMDTESQATPKSDKTAAIEKKKDELVEKTIQESISDQVKVAEKVIAGNKSETVENMDTDSQIEVKPIRTRKRMKSTSSNTTEVDKEIETSKTATRKHTPSKHIPKNKESTETEIKHVDESKTRKRAQSKDKDVEETTSKPKEVDEPKTPLTRKRIQRAKSTDVTKDSEELEAEKEDERKTPANRTQSITSNKSEETTPENVQTKTPTSTEVRKMVTRRMSREMRELDESNRSIEEVTPKRRGRRNTDDNDSVVSESSVASSLQSGETKSRRGRKSVLATKPDLSVIPEVLAEESREQSALDVINEYSGARRLTRHQKSLLETLIEPSSSKSRGRRRSNTSRASRSSLEEQEEEEGQSVFDLQPIDRISLLNKESYEGPPDQDELHLETSPESIASDATKMRRSRMARAASETKVVRAAKIHRRVASTDVTLGDSPSGSTADSPARGRRASFTRAVEALHTPKGRRTSTDSRKSDIGSPAPASPAASETDAPATPRRRRASTQSNTSQTRTRSKKMPVLEEVAEIKKK